ncbi:hypothetical protein C8R44DRAFT_751701 [Mycena epipterygia]|nr:hypothetical protein C8R44DRAFT_751701 [Mycena epipterygia]
MPIRTCPEDGTRRTWTVWRRTVRAISARFRRQTQTSLPRSAAGRAESSVAAEHILHIIRIQSNAPSEEADFTAETQAAVTQAPVSTGAGRGSGARCEDAPCIGRATRTLAPAAASNAQVERTPAAGRSAPVGRHTFPSGTSTSTSGRYPAQPERAG